MINNYKYGICSGCSEPATIVYKRGNLCMKCNGRRKSEEQFEKAKDRPVITKKAKQVMAADLEFYWSIWTSKRHYCEECDTKLPEFKKEDVGKYKIFFSHIISKGSEPRLRYHKDNINLLCGQCHIKWHSKDRSTMKIYEKDQPIIEKLKSELHSS